MKSPIIRPLLLIAAIAATRAVVGCTSSDDGVECVRNAECDEDEECTDGRCVSTDEGSTSGGGFGQTSTGSGATAGPATGSGGAPSATSATSGPVGSATTSASTSGAGGSGIDPFCLQFAAVWCSSCIPTPAADCEQTIADECDYALDLDDIGDCQGSIKAQYQCIVSTQCASISACSDCNAFPGCYPSYCN